MIRGAPYSGFSPLIRRVYVPPRCRDAASVSAAAGLRMRAEVDMYFQRTVSQ